MDCPRHQIWESITGKSCLQIKFTGVINRKTTSLLGIKCLFDEGMSSNVKLTSTVYWISTEGEALHWSLLIHCCVSISLMYLESTINLLGPLFPGQCLRWDRNLHPLTFKREERWESLSHTEPLKAPWDLCGWICA